MKRLITGGVTATMLAATAYVALPLVGADAAGPSTRPASAPLAADSADAATSSDATVANASLKSGTSAGSQAAPVAASAAPAGTPTDDKARALARKAAANFVNARAAQLRPGKHDVYRERPVLSGGNGVEYVPYTREYKGLPVRGGDFVVATNDKGQVLATSVAQARAIKSVPTTPAISAGAATAYARGEVDTVTSTGKPELVVHALETPRLAWKVNVSGTHADGDFSSTDVYVDAATGKVLEAVELVHYATGTGTSAYNGPSPLSIRTTESSSTSFKLVDPETPGLSCSNNAGAVMTKSTNNAWGNGSKTDQTTQCFDMMWAAQKQDQMLTDWLGRNSFDGNGGAWPLRAGLDSINAFYCPQGANCGPNGSSERVEIGHNQAGEWISVLDVMGHEMGHGIDHHTPGGISGAGTQEFVGDVFGTLTEFYANQSAQYDEPDYTIGEEVNLVGDGPIRNMYDPSQKGDPNCYSSSIPNTEVHAAAGPGNHWFYLLAEGNAPAGKPASSTCDNSNHAGIGIQKAGKIFYNAMLLKTSGASYLKYRTWTLTAAKNLYPGSCAEFNAVKAAWNAVSVPAQAADPVCNVAGTTVTVNNPGNKTGTVGTATSLQLTGSTTGSGALTWSATGLPAGLTLNATSGLISGTPTTAGTYNVTVTGKDSTNATGSASFTWTITGGSTPPASVTLANSVALSNCSGSLVRYPSSVGTDRALMLTNGHCLPTMPTAGQVITNQAVNRTATLLKADGSSAGTITADKILYATMTGTDVALYQLNETFDALKSRIATATPYTIASTRPAAGAAIAIPSGYHKRIWDPCTIDGFANLKEASWSFTDSIRYDANCDTIPGTSGSPIIGKATGQIVGINNTGNTNGEMCTMNNPCEVAADGTTSVRQGTSYGQQTYWFTTCLNSSRQIDLTVAGCKLAGATTTPPPPTGSNLIKNPGFESGAVDWTGTSGVITNSTSRPARTGSWKMWLGGNGRTASESVQQTVSIPANATNATLSYWIRIDTSESGSTVYDKALVQVVDGSSTSTLATYTNATPTSGYVQKTFNLTAYKGKTVTLKFSMTEDESYQTSFVIDDTALTVS